MRSIEKSLLFTCFFVFVICATGIPGAGATGVGLGPSELQIHDALRGTSVERTVTVYNLGDVLTPVTMSADGTAGSWVSFYSPDNRKVPVTVFNVKSRENIPVVVRITIPPDTANGGYNTTIHAKITPPELKGVELGVTASMEALTTITVDVTGQQTVSGTVDYILADDTEVNFPLTIRTLFRNTGNVAVNPVITATISGKTGTIDTVKYSATTINAGDSQVIAVRWNKTNIEPGNYTANVKVNLDNTPVTGSSVPFIVYPEGTLSRQGQLTGLSYDGIPSQDSLLKIIGAFENSGRIETRAKMIGEVYRDATLVDTFTTDELSIPVNDKGELTYYLKITAPGKYTVKAYVLYEGKKTETKELTFNTKGSSESPEPTQAPLMPVLAIAGLTGAVLLVLLRKKTFE